MTETQGPLILTVTGVMTGLALVVVGLRIYVRAFVVKKFGLDDMFMLSALAISIVIAALIVLQVQNGGGHHVADLTTPQRIASSKYQFIEQPLILIAICLIKLSIATFLLRLSPPKGYRRAILGVAIVLSLYTFACFFTIVFQCQPVSMVWGATRDGKCYSGKTFHGLSVANLASNIATDLFFAFLPIPLLWRIQMNRRTKVALMALLGLGIFACACAIARSVEVLTYPEDDDFLWDSSIITIWSVTEGSVGMITGSMPYLKPLFRKLNLTPFDVSEESMTLPDRAPKMSSRRTPPEDSSRLIYSGRPWYSRGDDDEPMSTFMMLSPTHRVRNDNSSEEVFFKKPHRNIVKTTEISVLDIGESAFSRPGSKYG
ncbi:hypothetical protein FQN54_006955 [Arachnomyces sp. PD_36]|nr:hypothetical protein FQN54_006955 [Arachnomyces sp. PD_36]